MAWPTSMNALRDILATLYPRDADARTMVASVGLDETRIAFDLRAVNTWRSVLEEAESQGRAEAVIGVALRAYPAHAGLLEAVEAYRQWAAAGRPDEIFGPGGRERLPYEPETVFIPAGLFLMGSVAGPGVPPTETPQHEVVLAAYRIGKYPVTNREYAEFVARQRNPLDFAPPLQAGWRNLKPPPDRVDHPAAWVTWKQALAYCDWLSAQTGGRYHLPSEAQWEKAASWEMGAGQLGTKRRYPWGDAWQEGLCNAGSDRTMAVTAHPAGASAYGCQDMAGNAEEWTTTAWGTGRGTPDYAYPYRADDGREDLQVEHAALAVLRIHRGGSYRAQGEALRCTARGVSLPDSLVPWRGFRVAMAV